MQKYEANMAPAGEALADPAGENKIRDASIEMG